MYIGAISAALAWGTLNGYLLIRAIDSFLILGIFSHSLINPGVQRENVATPGQTNPKVILRMMPPLWLYLFFSLFVLIFSFTFANERVKINYGSGAGMLAITTTTLVFISGLCSARNRLVIAWRMSHGYDYGGQRMWTKILKP